MLGKLIKNEYKATARSFLPLYLVLIVVTIVNKIIIEIQDGFEIETGLDRVFAVLTALLMITYFLTLFAVGVLTMILIIKRFYDNMLKDEGYLSFTLPVTTGQHLFSKVIVSYSWFVLSIIMIIAAILTIEAGSGMWEIITEMFRQMWEEIKNGQQLEFVSVIILIILAIYNAIMLPYTCFSIGQRFTKHPVLGAFLTYLVIYMINQAIGLIFLLVLVLGGNDIFVMEQVDVMTYILVYGLVIQVVEAIIYTVVTHFMLSRKLNLE